MQKDQSVSSLGASYNVEGKENPQVNLISIESKDQNTQVSTSVQNQPQMVHMNVEPLSVNSVEKNV